MVKPHGPPSLSLFGLAVVLFCQKKKYPSSVRQCHCMIINYSLHTWHVIVATVCITREGS